MRAASAALLDIETQELDTAIRTIQRNGQPMAQAFLCDKLENGAGYCRWLGQPSNFPKLLDKLDPYQRGSVTREWLGTHSKECDTSCNRCLRDFYNLPYHGLLDWRLAFDMARILVGDIDIDLASPLKDGTPNIWTRVCGASSPVARAMNALKFRAPEVKAGLRVYRHENDQIICIECHPLWTEEHPTYQQAKAEVALSSPRAKITMINPFRILRRPVDSLR